MRCIAILLLGSLSMGQSAPPRGQSLPRLLAILRPGIPDPLLARQFTPLHAPPGAYDVFVILEPIDFVAARVRRLAGSADVPGAWVVGPSDLSEAFGTVGQYDRSRLARLFGARRPSIARGPVVRGGAVVASLTLISPHPDAGLTELMPGTMIVATDLRGLP